MKKPSLENIILNEMLRDDRVYLWSEIASLTKINKNSLSSTLGRMLRKGLVKRVGSGLYRTNPMYGVGATTEPQKIQNYRAIATTMAGVGLDVPRELMNHVDEKVLGMGWFLNEEFLRVRLQFGWKRNKINFTIKAPLGLDIYGFLFCLDWVEAQLRDHGYHEEVDFVPDRCEILHDTHGLSLDGIKMLQWTTTDIIEKIYQKPYGVRHEYRIHGDKMSQTDLMALVQGGMPYNMILQQNNMAIKEMQKQSNAVQRFSVGAYETTQGLNRGADALNNNNQIMFRILDQMQEMAKDIAYLKGKVS